MNHKLLEPLMRRMAEGFLRCKTSEGGFQDPVNNIIDARPAGEIARFFLALNKLDVAKQAWDWIITQQNPNGSWKEITEIITEDENTLSTAVIVRSLLEGYVSTKKSAYLEAAKKGLMFILEKEFRPGYYIKSDNHYVDLLNMSATAAACFQRMYVITNNSFWKEAQNRALFKTIRHQFKDGAYPYTSTERLFPYEDHMNIRDLYYHSLTLFYLQLADPFSTHRYTQFSLKRAQKWLIPQIRRRTPWRNSKVIFTVGSVGFYGYSAFILANMQNIHETNICLYHLTQLQKNDGLFNRYESPAFFDSLFGYLRELFEWNYISPTNYSLRTRLWRLKRRVIHDIKERRKNKTSLFYSAQIANALAECYSRS